MARLYDRLLIEGTRGRDGRRTVPPALQDAGDELPVFDIQNVADYYHQYVYTEEQVWTLAALPNVAPPFPACWLEFELGAQHYANATVGMPARRYGLRIMAVDLDDPELLHQRDHDFQAEINRLYRGQPSNLSPELVRPVLPVDPVARGHAVWNWMMGVDVKRLLSPAQRDWLALQLRPYAPVRWVLTCSVYVEQTKSDIVTLTDIQLFVQPDGTIYHFYGEDGSVFLYPDHLPPNTGALDVAAEQHLLEEVVGSILIPGLLAISFLHCTNVQVALADPPPAKLAQAYRRKKGRDLVRFHVLQIAPMQRVLATEGQIAKTGLRQALHICRGHFKDYRTHGLFGRHKGLYWWDAHVRGTVDQGIVDKEYQVQAPADLTAEEA